MYAIINDRGNQATVREGDVLRLDLQGSYEPGQKITMTTRMTCRMTQGIAPQ